MGKIVLTWPTWVTTSPRERIDFVSQGPTGAQLLSDLMCTLCINALFPIGLDAFAKLRKTTVSFVVPAWPSVCHQETTRIPLDGFSWHLTLENFSKICWNNSGFIKMWLRGTRWFKYDRGWFVCKQAALRSSCATLKEWSQNLHHPSCSG